MSLDFILDIIITILFVPIQVILLPIDALLAQIPGIGIVSGSISAISSFIGSIPSTLVNLVGLSPLLWNSLLLLFILYVSLAPVIQMAKKVWAWIRP